MTSGASASTPAKAVAARSIHRSRPSRSPSKANTTTAANSARSCTSGRDTSGVNHRPISGFYPHDGSFGDLSFQATYFRFYNWSDLTNPILVDLANKKIDLSQSMSIRSANNNIPLLYQLNAAGSSYIAVARVDGSDRVRMDAPLFVIGSMPATANFVRLQPNSVTEGSTILYAPGPAWTGAYGGFDFNGLPTNDFTNTVSNGDTTSATANARLKVQSGGASGGDALLEWRINNVISAVAGLDNSDSDKWKLAYNSQALGTNDMLSIDGSKIELFIAPKLPSYTVAGVPSATTLGAGALIYVNNESGGATLAFSDGTNWKRVSDLATIS